MRLEKRRWWLAGKLLSANIKSEGDEQQTGRRPGKKEQSRHRKEWHATCKTELQRRKEWWGQTGISPLAGASGSTPVMGVGFQAQSSAPT
jgi:hypothetical protein